MRKLAFLICGVVCAAVPAVAQKTQSNPFGAALSVQDAGTCSTAGSFLWQTSLSPNAGTTTVNLSGTFSGTLTIRLSNNGGQSWTTNSTTSSVGTTAVNTNGFTDICADVTNYTSGTFQVTIFTAIGGSGSISSQQVAPNQVNFYASQFCGTQTNCFPISSTNGDNASNFAALFAASNASTITLNPVDLRTAPQSGGGSGLSSLTINSTNIQGDTAFVFAATSSKVATVTDSASESYTALFSGVSTGAAGAVFEATTSKVFNSVTITPSSADFVSAVAISVPGVSSVASSEVTSSGSSVTPSISLAGVPANSMIIAECTLGGASSGSFTNVNGRNRAYLASVSGTNIGLIVWATYSASGGSVTSSGTTGTSTNWACQAFYVNGGGTTQGYPVIDIARGYYFYSSGMNPTIPTVIRCEPGTVLAYTGTGDAEDWGPIGGYTSGQGASNAPTYMESGCQHSGGSQMTNGIVFQKWVTATGINNDIFYNFGNASSYMIQGNAENWDMEIGPQNKFVIDDYQPRQVFNMNAAASSFNSFVRFHDNLVTYLGGHGQPGTGSGSNTAIGLIIDGLHSQVYHNNIEFFAPDIWLRCSNSPCVGNQIEGNIMETPNSTIPIIQFSTGVDRPVISENRVWLHGASSFIGPHSGTDVLTGANVDYNQVGELASSAPVIALNNVSGNTNNQAWMNLCSIGATTLTPNSPCPLLHTSGASITQWNGDYFPKLTFASSTTASYTFTANGGSGYSVAPGCTIPPNIPGTTTTLTITTLSATTLTITASASNSATVYAHCSAGDAQ